MTVVEGADFAGYRVGSVIGHGGMGVVHEAVHLTLDRRVALKLIGPALATDPVFRERFKRESQAAASLHHPHVVTIHDAGEVDGQLYLVMEYVDGYDLGDLLRNRGSLSARETVDLIAPVADALDAAHSLGLVHRDVKPENIMIRDTRDGTWPLLTDFGLTRNVSSGATLTGTGQWIGTLDYIAPEQITGQPVDARTDIYSLGCVFFEALSGEVPYPADSDVAKLWSQVHDPPPRLDEVVPAVGPEMTEVLLKAMAKDPDDRFASAGELASAAEGVLSDPGEPRRRKERRVAATRAAPIPTDTSTRSPAESEGPSGSRKRSRSVRVLGPIGALAVAGLGVGILASSLFGQSGPGESISRGNIVLEFSEPWQRFNGTEGIRGFEVADPIRLNERNLAGAGLLRAGRVTDAGDRLDPLPDQLRSRFIDNPKRDLAEINGSEWWRYRGQVRDGSGENGITVVMIESSKGYQGLACEGPSEAAESFSVSCDEVISSLGLRNADAISPRPSEDLARLLGSVQDSLAKAERATRPGLSAENTGRQASAAKRLSVAYGKQAARTRNAPDRAGVEGPLRDLTRSLTGLEQGYARLSKAARNEDSEAHEAASRKVDSAADRYRRALRELSRSGYRFGE